MDLKIKDKVAVVAASSSGLGLAVAEALAAEGAKLAICSRSKERIAQAAENISAKYNVEVLGEVCDVTDRESLNSFKNRVIDHFQTCHILFTNAGGPPPGKIEDFESDKFKEAIDLNLISAIDLIYAFLPEMKKQKWGRIIASTSITVKQPIKNLVLSNVSRIGLVAFVKSLSDELAYLNITANSVAPGYIMTDRVEDLLKDQVRREKISYQDALKRLSAAIPVKKIASPADFAALVAFLAAESSSYITGQTILIDGGLYKGVM